jgi:glycosyltransferase involved in cell wall biosynthesis
MRVLLSAYAFSPYRGSECAVGWNIARELAKLHDVTVITGDVKNSGFEAEYQKYVHDNGDVQGLTVVYLRPTRLIAFIDQLHELPGLWALYYLAYNLWQRMAYRKARELHAQCPFDVVHHLTMIGYREPGYMWKLGIPFFWGPVGGGPDEPIAFHSLYSISAKFKVIIRNMLNSIQKWVLMRPRIAARHARQIWVVTDADEKMVNGMWGVKCERMVETAAQELPLRSLRTWDGTGLLRIVWSGTHTYGKALPILIKAVAAMKAQERQILSVDVLGEGGETDNWKRLAEECDVANVFKWIGRLSHDKALEAMSSSHVLVCTSLKEASSVVVTEALSLGLPVICHDACGMGIVVTDKCGIKIPLKNPETSIVGFATALENLLETPGVVAEKSRAALERASELTWEAKAIAISKAYESIEK